MQGRQLMDDPGERGGMCCSDEWLLYRMEEQKVDIGGRTGREENRLPQKSGKSTQEDGHRRQKEEKVAIEVRVQDILDIGGHIRHRRTYIVYQTQEDILQQTQEDIYIRHMRTDRNIRGKCERKTESVKVHIFIVYLDVQDIHMYYMYMYEYVLSPPRPTPPFPSSLSPSIQ